MKTITFLLFFSFSISTLLAQDFYLNSNGVTCMCPAASVGDTGVVNGDYLYQKNQTTNYYRKC